jgi:hypothetical protein
LDEEDDIDFMMRVLNVDQSAFRALARSGTNTIMPGEIRLERGTETDDETGVITPKFKSNGDPYYCLRFRRANEEYFARFPDGTAGCRKILDLLVAKAREICKQRLTLLLVEGLGVDSLKDLDYLRPWVLRTLPRGV